MGSDLNSPDARKHFKGEQTFNSAKNVGNKKFNLDLIANLSKVDSMVYLQSNEILPGLPTQRNSQVNSGSFIGMGLGTKKNSV